MVREMARRRLPESSGWLTVPGSASQIVVQGVAFALTRAALLLASVLTARIAGVEAYGSVAIGLVVYQAGVLLRDAGLGQAVVILGQRRGLAWAAFIIATVVGTCVGGAMWASAQVVSTLVGVPGATQPIRLLAVAFAVGSVGVVPNGMLERRLRFSARAVIDVLAYGALLVTTLACLRAGLWVEALAVGYLVQSLVQSVIAVALARPWTDRGAPFGAILGLARYGSLLWASAAFAYLSANLDNLIVAWLGGPSAVGAYALFYSVATMITIAPSQVVNRVALAHYGRAVADRNAIERAARGALRLSAGLSFLPAAAIALTAPEVAAVAAGPAAPAVALVVLAAYGLARSVGICLGTVLNGVGLARHGVTGAALNATLMTVLIPLGYLMGGLPAAAAAVLAAMLVSLLYMARRSIPVLGGGSVEVGVYGAMVIGLAVLGSLLALTPTPLRLLLIATVSSVWVLGLLRVELRGVVTVLWRRPRHAESTARGLDAQR